MSGVSTSNVRNIESLEAFHGGLFRIADRWQKTLQEIRLQVQRADEYFSQQQPAYWRRQTQLAERELNDAKEYLAQKRAAVRHTDKVPATEAAVRVRKAEQRLRDCHEKQRLAKKWAVEMNRQCDEVLGPLAEIVEHCESLLPGAARELRVMIDQLRRYADRLEKGE